MIPPTRIALIFGMLALAVADLPAGAVAKSEIKKTTHTYKTVGDLEIKATIYRLDDDVARQVVVYIHGGALINGNRGRDRLSEMLLEAGYAVVCIDYRLAPETKLPAIIEDLEDAFRWIRREGPTLANLDTSKIAVIGNSAGGYLTLTAGFRVQPRPTVLVSFYGYGDLIGDWYSKPSPNYRHNKKTLTDQEAQAVAAGPPIAQGRDRDGDGGAFYRYCRVYGLWPKYVGGFDPHTEAEKFYPYMPCRNVSPDYPPTLLIHGQKDTDVPHEQSVMMATQFKKYGVPYVFVSIKNAGHGLGGATKSEKRDAYQQAFDFVERYMNTDGR